MNASPLPQHQQPPGFLWPEHTLWDDIASHAVKSPNALAVVDDGVGYTYQQLVRASERLAGHYRDRGVGPGDVVVVQLDPVAGFAPAFLAAERLGAIVCPVLPGIRGGAFRKVAGLAAPSLIVTSNELEQTEHAATDVPIVSAASQGAGSSSLFELLESASPSKAPLPPAPGPGALSELAFTSGTTGIPKGVLHTHATATAGILSTLRRQQITASDTVHVALPVGHNFGFFYGVRLGLHAGAKVVLQRRWSPDHMLDLAAEHGITVSSGPPVFLSDLLEKAGSWGDRLQTLRLFTCAGAKLDHGLAAEAVATLPGRVSKAFGMTELGHVCSTTADSPIGKILVTEGVPHPEIEMRVVGSNGETVKTGSEGELAFRGPFLMVGYHGGHFADAIDTEGFFRTGDLGHADKDGYLVVTGRVTNLIIRGGENIPADAVGRSLSAHCMVREAVIVGVPDRRLGERPVACIDGVAETSFTVAEVGEILERADVPAIHWPEAVVMVDVIPRTATGKVALASLMKQVAERVIFERKDGDE